MIDMICRAVRGSIRSTHVSAGVMTITNAINSTLGNFVKGDFIKKYWVDCVKIMSPEKLSVLDDTRTFYPGQLYVDSDNKISGLVISSQDKRVTILRSDNYKFSKEIILVKLVIYFDKELEYLHIEEPR